MTSSFPDEPRSLADLHDEASFDHVGRDAGVQSLVAGQVLTGLARDDERIVVGTADLTWVTHLSMFKRRFPDRFFQFGIAERNMISVAAGMATCGLIPYVSTFASFSAILAYENIRTDLAYPHLPVRILATHAGISMGFFGTSHHATEDIACLRPIAGLTVVSPPDAAAMERLLRLSVDHEGPIYFRLSRGRERELYADLPDSYGLGEPHVARSGRDLLIVATGIMVGESLTAAVALEGRGISATVLDVHTLKPFPSDAIAEHAAKHVAVVSVEEHNVEGGLGTMTAEALLLAGVARPVYRHGMYDEFAIVGPPNHLYRYYGLDAVGIETVALRMLDKVDATAAGPTAGQRLWTEEDRRGVLASLA